MLLILPSSGKLIIQDHVSERIAYAHLFGHRAVSLCVLFCLRAGSLFILVLPSGEKLILQHYVFERIAYALLLNLRAVSLCFSF